MTLDIALVSCRELPEPDPDAAPLADALDAAGLSWAVMAWDDPHADWTRARAALLRSCWNYPQDPRAFRRWLEATARVCPLWNPLPVVRWNLHKGYLHDLERQGLPVVPTALVPKGTRLSLRALVAERGWERVVVKPAVSAASYRTRCVGRDELEAGEAHLRALAADGDVLVQPYLESVEHHGERALVWIDGELTHAVRKSPRFSGEHESVSESAVAISPAEAEVARGVLDAVEGPLPYARVDLAPGADGRPLLMELELIEPSLFFAQGPPRALERFVAGLRARLA